MPVFTVESPDGRRIKVEAADQATALRGAQEYAASNPKKSSALDQIGAFAQSATEQIPFLDEAAAGVVALATGSRYEGVRKRQRELAAGDRRDRPLARNAGGVAGFGATVVAPGGGYIAGAKSLPQAVKRGAQVGGAYGLLQGAGTAPDGGLATRGPGAVAGGLIGTVTGGALPVVGNQLMRLLPKRGAAVPKPEARVGGVLERGIARDEATPAAIADAARKAPERAAFEAGGTNVRSLAEVVAQTPGKGRTILEQKLGDRSVQAMRERVTAGLEDAVGADPAAVAGDFAAHAKTLREAAAPLYDEAYSFGGVDSPKLRSLMSRPSMRAAMGRAVRIAQEEGRNPAEIGFELRSKAGPRSLVPVKVTERVPGGGTRDRTVMQPGPQSKTDELVELQNPTAQTWDYVKRGLDDLIESRRDPVTRRLKLDEKGRAELGTLNALRDELTTINPAYRRALDAGGDPLRLEEAFRDASRLMNNTVSVRAFGERWAKLTPSQQEAWRGGWLNHVHEQVAAGRLNIATLRTPAYQAKLRTVFGDEAAARIAATVEESADMAGVNRRLFGGSPTEPRMAARADLEAQGADPLDMLAGAIDTGLNPARLTGKALKETLRALPRKDRSVLGDPQMNELLGRALADADEMTRLLNRLEVARAQSGPPAGLLGSYPVPALSGYAASRK